LEREADVDAGVGTVPVVGAPRSRATVAGIGDEEAELISGPDYDT
jgi:tetrahydromethanopterin S-methyltransferase subunit D